MLFYKPVTSRCLIQPLRSAICCRNSSISTSKFCLLLSLEDTMLWEDDSVLRIDRISENDCEEHYKKDNKRCGKVDS
jgi:hypothetical protein